MKRVMQEMEAVAQTLPSLRPILNPETLELDMHLSYDAEMQYVRKPPETRLIMCSSLDDVVVGEPVMVTYHCGMRAYQHSRHVVVSNESNCTGGFFYTDGTEA